MTKEALFYTPEAPGQICCRLCPHGCIIPDGKPGRCHVRRNRGGRLFSTNYGRVAAMSLDPVEKKPLYHFLPGSTTLSIAGAGCNMRCLHCQNHTLSQAPADGDPQGSVLLPREIVTAAAESGAPSLSFTYSEPTVFYEMMLDCARLAKEGGLRTVMVSNGFINPEPLDVLIPHLDAANIDLKGFTDRFYEKICGGKLNPVLQTLKQLHAAGVWLEITTLIIPGYNDNPRELLELMDFIGELDPKIPWHVSRFFPHYRLLDSDATPADQIHEILGRAHDRGLKHIYSGNLPAATWQNTLCSRCRTPLIKRHGYRVELQNLDKEFRCTACSTRLAGVFVAAVT